MIAAQVHVTLKSSVLDPQGAAVTKSLQSLGFAEVTQARVGKFLELTLDTDDTVEAAARVEAMCEQLLANTVIERYTYELDASPATDTTLPQSMAQSRVLANA